MHDDQVADLKQFITTVISQQVTELREDIRGDIETNINRLDRKIDDLSTSVAEALDTNNEETESKLKNHEKRIIRLERKAA